MEESLKITPNLHQLLEDNQGKADGMVKNMLFFYLDQYIMALKGSNEPSAAYSMQLHLDEVIEEVAGESDIKISCSKGCYWCCEQMVAITGHEAQLIVEWCASNDLVIDKAKLIRQSKLTDASTWTKSVDKQCIFLKDGICSIYQVRPMTCRKYLVASPPRKCNSTVKKLVKQFVDIKIEVIVSAVQNISLFLPLPEQLLKRL